MIFTDNFEIIFAAVFYMENVSVKKWSGNAGMRMFAIDE